jgi:hypothetical protein
MDSDHRIDNNKYQTHIHQWVSGMTKKQKQKRKKIQKKLMKEKK